MRGWTASAVLLAAALSACEGERRVGPPETGLGRGAAAPTDVSSADPPCRALAADLFVDHVILAVRDLPAAVQSFRGRGFTVKPGRAHPDGLLNAHVKFETAQEVELMTLAGPASGPIAEGYARILEDGEGGAYLALAGPALDSVARAASSLGLHPARPSSGQAGFVSFPEDSAAMAVFFGGRSSVIDPDSLLEHANGAVGLEEIRVEGGPELIEMLRALGAVSCPQELATEGGEQLLGLSNAQVLVSERRPGRRPRLLGGRLTGLAEELVWFDGAGR